MIGWKGAKMEHLIEGMVALMIKWHRQGNIQSIIDLCHIGLDVLEKHHITDFYEKYYKEDSFKEEESEMLKYITEYVDGRKLNISVHNVYFVEQK